MQPISEPAPRKPRRWPVALLVAFFNAIAGGAIGLPVALWAMKILDVSRFEGSSDFGVAFVWTPLAILSGFVVGFVASFFITRTGFAGYAIRQGIALLTISSLVAAAAGVCYAKADHPPRIDGKRIEVQFELRVPTKGRSIEELHSASDNPFSIRFMTGDSFASYAREDWSLAQRTPEFITIPIRGVLHSQESRRVLTASEMKGKGDQVFSVLLPPAPKKIDEIWTPWLFAEVYDNGQKPVPDDRFSLRYRVRFAEE